MVTAQKLLWISDIGRKRVPGRDSIGGTSNRATNGGVSLVHSRINPAYKSFGDREKKHQDSVWRRKTNARGTGKCLLKIRAMKLKMLYF